MKKFMLFLSVIIFFVILPTNIRAAENDITFFANGREVRFDSLPVNVNGRLMVPLSNIAVYSGATLEWNDHKKEVYMEYLNKYIVLTINKNIIISGFLKGSTVIEPPMPIKVDVPPILINNRTFVPIRAVANAFGSEVNYDDTSRSVSIDIPEIHMMSAASENQYSDIHEFDNLVNYYVNIERQKEGLPPLYASYHTLRSAAQIRVSEIMQVFSGTRPDGREFNTIAEETGIVCTTIGELITKGYNTPEEVVQAWFGMDEAKTLLMSTDYLYLSVGVARGSDGIMYWVASFCD